MNYGYNPYTKQQMAPMYQPSSSGFGGIGKQMGGGLRDAYGFYQQQQAFDQANNDLASMMADPNVSDEEINKYMASSGAAPGFASNPRGYLINKAGEGVVSGAKMASEGIMEGAGKVGGALKGLGSSL